MTGAKVSMLNTGFRFVILKIYLTGILLLATSSIIEAAAFDSASAHKVRTGELVIELSNSAWRFRRRCWREQTKSFDRRNTKGVRRKR
jgi:hypothetical protein